jgi:phosphoglycerol transferase MdoB-like AlkP superfamily enzyme
MFPKKDGKITPIFHENQQGFEKFPGRLKALSKCCRNFAETLGLVQQFKHFISQVAGQIILKQFCFALLLLSLSRIVWFGFNNFWLEPYAKSEVFKALVWGVYFDLPVLAFFFFPLWGWMLVFPRRAQASPKTTALIFLICISFCLTLNGVDTIYSQITTRRSGYELFSALADPGNHLLTYIRNNFISIGILLALLLIIYRMVPRRGHSLYLYNGPKRWVVLRVLAVLGIWIVAARGGFRLKPLNAADAGVFTSAKFVPLVSSTPMQMISTWGQAGFEEFHFMDDQRARQIIASHAQNPGKANARQYNVLVLVVESLGRDYTGFLNGQPFTPFLDSLSKSAVVFPYCYANGIRSIEMVPSIFCGLPSLMDEHYINSSYGANELQNIFGWFSKRDYSAAFFHGGANGTMRFQSFLRSTGLPAYYGLNEYPNKERDYDGSWGIYDEPYLQYVARCLDTVRKPFFTGVFTLSSHHPYELPEKYKNTFPEGDLPIHKTVAYADHALRLFFDYAREQPWFANTIFIITGDHTSHSTNPYFYSETGHYEIPLLFYSQQLAPVTVNKTISQCDIMPTLLDLMQWKNTWPSLGRSALDSSYAGYSFHRDNRVNFILHYPYTLGMRDDGKVTEFYSRLRNKTTVQHLKRSGEPYESMLLYLKAYLQVYSQTLIHNRRP